jgi:hypothetical protein
LKEIKFSKLTKKIAMKQGAFSILMSFALILAVIGAFIRGINGIGAIFLLITFVSIVFSISFIIKLRKLENLNYLVFEKDRLELNSNFTSMGKIIKFNDINKVQISKKHIEVTVGKKPYYILFQHIEPEYIKEVGQLLMKYNRK